MTSALYGCFLTACLHPALQFYGFSATTSRKTIMETPPGIIHPNSFRYQVWWYTTVLVAAITAFLQPYYIAFAPPGL